MFQLSNEIYSLYADGSALNNPGPAGAGAVLFDPSGNQVFMLSDYLGKNTNNYAEYQGLIHGASEALKLGVKNIEIFMDSMLVVKQVNGEWKVKSPNLFELVAKSKELLSNFESWKLSYIPREKNTHADHAAKKASDKGLIEQFGDFI